MKPLELNLSRFRKVHDDGNTATFQSHDNPPHSITIAHKALPKEMRSYMKALPLYTADQADPVQAKGLAKGGVADALKNKRKAPGASQEKLATAMQSGGRAYYDDGGVASKDAMPNPAPTQNDDSQTPAPAGTPITINVGTPQSQPNVQVPSASNATPVQQQAAPPTQDASASQGATNDESNGLATAQAQMSALNPKAPDQNGAPELSAQQINPEATTPGFLPGYAQKYAGLAEQARAQGALGQAEGEVQNKGADAMQQIVTNNNAALAKWNAERQALQKDVRDGHIDPNHYWQDHSKIAAGLGIILAGFNPTNRPNGAVEFLQNAIKRDTDAQAANLGAKQDILNHFYQAFGNQTAASQFSIVAKQDQVAAQLRAAAAKSQNAIQRGRFNEMAGQLQSDSAQKMLPLAAMQGAFESMHQGIDPSPALPSLRLAQPEYAKTIEEHLFPGEGYSDKPIPQDVSNSIGKQKNILLKTKRLQDWIDSNTVGGKLSPAHRGEGEALAAELAQFYRQGTGASTSEAEQKTIGSFIDQNPGGFLSAYINDPKLHALSGSMKDSIDTIHDAYGFHPFKGAAPAQAAPQRYKSVYSPKLGRNVLVPG